MSGIDYLSVMTKRYAVSPEALASVLCPILVPIATLDKQIHKLPGQTHYRASFTVAITPQSRGVITRGRTGKFVPAQYGGGQATWREIAKGRIISVDMTKMIAEGEVYVGSNRKELEAALSQLTIKDSLEIDQYGAAAKVLSGLAEYHLVKNLEANGYTVLRMPEDMARHLGYYANYDFLVTKNGVAKKVEAKSIWGTDTRFARLIHSLTAKPKTPEASWTPEQRANYYPTSSCKFQTQDIFAVSMFLRTGNITDFAFARSVPKDMKPYGLPRAGGFPEHVNQNPLCQIGDGTWFATIDEVWNLK